MPEFKNSSKNFSVSKGSNFWSTQSVIKILKFSCSPFFYKDTKRFKNHCNRLNELKNASRMPMTAHLDIAKAFDTGNLGVIL